MRHTRSPLFGIICLLSLAGQGWAAERQPDEVNLPAGAKDPKQTWTLNLYLDNDLFTHTDQQYTNGVKASWISPDLEAYGDDESLPAWLRNLNSHMIWLSGKNPAEQRNIVFSVGQTMYTPADKYATQLIKDDRPYAGWLFAGLAYQRRYSNTRLEVAEIQLGVVGPASLAHQAQDFIHDLRGIDRFEGWDNQLKNEPGLVVTVSTKDRLFRRALGKLYSNDLIGHYSVSAGNVLTGAGAGLEYRIGYRLPSDFGSSSIRPAGDNSAPGARWDSRVLDGGFGWHVFASVEGRMVLHNIFLDGNTFVDSPSVDKKTWVGDLSTGVSFTYSNMKLTISRVNRSREFETQKEPHSYGSIAFSMTY
ncbi:lipid A deacylase LpxR family protein [Pokkaliibacter sp. MBI-7]|uniref:lipid A deacylase LpxR family protein n=1 Tax=Pokkaliibacter sp. MBI-7 TaxID=3040600 RepID=UPI00244D6890|nr:lipid A deacylase LpxR family protein [Pokkaliibacter sp. MBI-7]MDH2432019.1 lipid A deacylase LpxR family protein [Pokkaliibacter sp. MBI-7]